MDRRRSALLWAALLVLGACRADDGGGGEDASDTAGPTTPATTDAVPTTADTPSATEPAATVPAGADARFLVAESAVGRLEVFAGPDASAPARTLDHPNAEGGPLVLRVLASRGDRLQVDLPVRPNGATGWVRASDVSLSSHAFHLEVRLAERLLIAYEGDRVVLQEPIGVGREPTPTPGGDFYLYELLRPPDPAGAYGPYAFGLSGFSENLTSFAGGDGRLGIHGTNDPASLGVDSTHGCIRLANPAIVQLAETVPLGAPVVILP